MYYWKASFTSHSIEIVLNISAATEDLLSN